MTGLLAVLLGAGLLSAANRHVEQGNRLFAEGKLNEALGEYDQAVRQHPAEPGVHLNRGAALYGLGKFDEAQQEFLRASEAHDPKIKESAFYNMGNAFYKMQRFKEATEAYKRALGTDPRDMKAKWNLELALRQLAEEQQKKEQQQKDAKNDSQKPEQGPQKPPPEANSQKPEQRPLETGKQAGTPPKDREKPGEAQPPAGAQAEPDHPVERQETEAVLDALERGEKNLELEQARLRARGRRKPSRDY